ncbi:Hypothetical predicted protein [Podarcis lilfordi]|uniref:Secreted protein n=1 Tax=Podarcis lilfordi TaxID=74358 RepID=A0AA35KE51_9SAUR|nr:Hypothetical predicted protein [Podarcis lilfordi]
MELLFFVMQINFHVLVVLCSSGEPFGSTGQILVQEAKLDRCQSSDIRRLDVQRTTQSLQRALYNALKCLWLQLHAHQLFSVGIGELTHAADKQASALIIYQLMAPASSTELGCNR